MILISQRKKNTKLNFKFGLPKEKNTKPNFKIGLRKKKPKSKFDLFSLHTLLITIRSPVNNIYFIKEKLTLLLLQNKILRMSYFYIHWIDDGYILLRTYYIYCICLAKVFLFAYFFYKSFILFVRRYWNVVRIHNR